jgi:PAT family beta-lactamase induction signal transducer AmpG
MVAGCQVALIFSISSLGFRILQQSLAGRTMCFSGYSFSASQDIVADAYRREDLPDAELGLGSSLYINGYRLGMLLASGGG